MFEPTIKSMAKQNKLEYKSVQAEDMPENMRPDVFPYFYLIEDEKMLETTLFGNNISNPIGLAAGFDKSAEVYNSLFKFGFGFIEVGTVTPKQQLGNPKPRIFRLEKDLAIINRLGFNNEGMHKIKNRLAKYSRQGIVGINIGANKNSNDQSEDYCKVLTEIHSYVDYATINILSLIHI